MTYEPVENVGANDIHARFPEFLARVESGQEFTITRQGLPVARLIPVKPENSVEQRGKAIEQIKQLSRGLSLDGLHVSDLIREGRR